MQNNDLSLNSHQIFNICQNNITCLSNFRRKKNLNSGSSKLTSYPNFEIPTINMDSHAKTPVDFFDQFRTEKICMIPATNTKRKRNTFESMRPQQGTCLEYNISETDTKVDAGATKIHIKQVHATYTPIPPEMLVEIPQQTRVKKKKKKHSKYCHSAKPVYVFEEDKILKRIEKEQEHYKSLMKRRIARNRKQNRAGKLGEHEVLLDLCGPDWFMELSPNQKRNVDKLQEAILRDLKFGGILATKDILAQVGLLLRPNSKLVEIVLRNCCKCPVEFLLTLYQLTNPNRTSYSLNDMIILSSVVHLTIRKTLKEMHIRLPSPPPAVVPPKPLPKRKKISKYSSPYLEPGLFIRSKPTDLETWVNRHLSYPKNEYFSYLKDLEEQRHPTFNARSRLRMSREKINISSVGTLENELMAAQYAYNQMHEYYAHEDIKLLRASIYNTCEHKYTRDIGYVTNNDNVDSNNQTDVETNPTSMSVAVELEITEEFDENQKCTMAKVRCQIDVEEDQQDGSISDIDDIPHDDEIEDTSPCARDIPKNILCSCINRIANGTERDLDSTEVEDAELSSSEQDVLDPKSRIPQILEPVKCAKLIEVKPRVSSKCICRQIVEKRVEDSVCQCDRCKEDRDKANIKTTFVISDTKIINDEGIRIISDVMAEKRCQCYERYQKKVNKIDHNKEIQKAHEHLVDLGKPFIINGVAIGLDGKPIYNLSAGVAPKYECSCYNKELDTEEDPSKKLATMPEGRQKYVISGVHSTPQGNVFVISGVVPTDDCDCMALYNKFVEQHNPCMQLYQAYLEKIAIDTKEYMDDLKLNQCDECDLVIDDESNQVESNTEEEVEDFACRGCTNVDPSTCTDSKPTDTEVTTDHSSEDDDDDSDAEETVMSITVEIEKTKKPEGVRRLCVCNLEEPEPEKPEVIEEITEYERYLLLERFPLNVKSQVDVVKKVLEKLAADGFPLARLPDCHRLPIFKLWMAKRTHKFWTQKDRSRLLTLSKMYWNHMLRCQANATKKITLGFSDKRANEFTWADAKLVKEYTSSRSYDYQRKQRQCSIATAREFFPTLFMYEFPKRTFTDVFFAYMPSKEEDVLYYNIWKAHDFRNQVMCRVDARINRLQNSVHN